MMDSCLIFVSPFRSGGGNGGMVAVEVVDLRRLGAKRLVILEF